MQFAYPQLRIYLLLAIAAAALALLQWVRKRRALRRLAQQGIHQPGMLVRPVRQIFKCALLLLAAGLLGIAVLGPQWGWTEEEVPPRRGHDVLILLDVSRSMLAEDVAPNRLERARADLRDLADLLERTGGYRIGLLAFAERAALMCPLTSDYRCFAEELADASLESLRIHGRPAWGDGTQIYQALQRAGQMIDDANAPYTDLLLASDGEDMAHETLAAAQSLSRRGITVHTLGLGDSSHVSLIPVRDNLGRLAHLRYRGELVHTHLQEAILRAIAETSHGHYFAAQTSYRDLDRQFGELLAAKEKLDRQTVHRERRGIHRFAWFVTPALLLLLLHGFLSDARRPGRTTLEKPSYFTWIKSKNPIASSRSPILAGLIFIAAGSLATSAGPANVREAWTAFHHGNKLLHQAQQSGTNADPAALVEAQQHYQACLSNEPLTPDAGSLFDNARHNLEMTKLLLMQISRSGINDGQTEPNQPHPPKPSDTSARGEKKNKTDTKSNQASESSNTEKDQSSSQQQKQQQPQGQSEICSTCQNGQNSSANARKMKEGRQGPGPGQGATPSPSRSSANHAEQSPSASDAASLQPEPSGKPEPKAGGLHPAKSPTAKENPPVSLPNSQGESTSGRAGKETAARRADPIVQAAEQRLHESIQRIEKRRGRARNSPEPSPEDPANQNRYRDW